MYLFTFRVCFSFSLHFKQSVRWFTQKYIHTIRTCVMCIAIVPLIHVHLYVKKYVHCTDEMKKKKENCVCIHQKQNKTKKLK